jgi:hypothetical protein
MSLWIAETTMEVKSIETSTAAPIPRAARISALEAITKPEPRASTIEGVPRRRQFLKKFFITEHLP